MDVDKRRGYFDGLTVELPRYIPTFEEACEIQRTRPELFDTHIFTRTFVAFGPERKFKFLDIDDLLALKERPRQDGFPVLSLDEYNDLPKWPEYELNENYTLDHRAENLESFGTSWMLRGLIASRVEEREQMYLHARYPNKKEEMLLLWIKRLNQTIPAYLAPMRVGSRGYYIGVGEDRIDPQPDVQFPFLRIPKRE